MADPKRIRYFIKGVIDIDPEESEIMTEILNRFRDYGMGTITKVELIKEGSPMPDLETDG